MLVVPKVILSNVFRMTSTASKMPIHQHWHTQSFVLLNDIINIYIYIYIYIYIQISGGVVVMGGGGFWG